MLYHLKIAWRKIWKNKFFSAINIAGLSLGMASTIVIVLWAKDQMSINHQFSDLNKLFIVRVNQPWEGKIYTNELTPGLLQNELSRSIPEVKFAVKCNYLQDALIKVSDKSIKEKGFYATDDLFDVFQIPTIEGNASQALKSNNKVILTESVAKKILQKSPFVGKSIQLDNKYYVVGAVIEDFPQNSTFNFSWVSNLKSIEQNWMNSWENNSFHTFVRLQDNVSIDLAQDKMKTLYSRYANINKNNYPVLQPVADMYLYNEYENGQVKGGLIENVKTLLLIAVFILIIACINFINLATSQSVTRSKEVGVRKSLGAGRMSIVRQFIGEASLISTLSLALSIIFLLVLLKLFNNLFDAQLSLNFGDVSLWLSLVFVVLITSFLSGMYPAIYLSGLLPAKVLRGTAKINFSQILIRKGLVVFQFILSISFLIGMAFINRQLNFIYTKPTGIDRNNLLYVQIEGKLWGNIEPFRQELIRLPGVISAAAVNEIPMDIGTTSTDLNWPSKDPNKIYQISVNQVGYDFAKTMGIKIIEGSDYTRKSDSSGVKYIVNEAAVELMKLRNPVGQDITFWNGKGAIIGVMKDFHLQSMYVPITPLVLILSDKYANQLFIKTQPNLTNKTLERINTLFKKFNPDYPFVYNFADDKFKNMYKVENAVSSLIKCFGVFAVFISWMGLLALSILNTEQRKREISIRKILGASVYNIFVLLVFDFLKLIILAFVVASIISSVIVNRWLQKFVYKVDLEISIFFMVGLLAVFVALTSVLFQCLKASHINPIQNIKSN